MNVVVDSLPHERGGGITYLKNILPQLENTNDQYYVLVPEDRNSLDESQTENVDLVEVGFPIQNLLLRLFYQQVILPFVLLSLDADVLYSPGDITTFFAPCSTAVAVRNPNPYFKQSNHSTAERLRFRMQRFLTRLSVVRSTAVIFVSKYSKMEMNRLLHADEEKCHVVYHGIDVDLFRKPLAPDDEYLIKEIQKYEPFVLCVSTIYKHKNYEALIQGYARLPEEIRDEYPLVIAGGCPNKNYHKSISDLIKSEGVENDVVFLGRVDYEYVPYLYANAEVSVLPSKLETFGHPLVESMAAGTPVVAADATCIPEITGGAALLFEPDDYEKLSEHLETIFSDETVAKQLVADGYRRAQHFSWERTAQETHKVLRIAGE